MGILYQASDPTVWVVWLFVLFALMAFNELGRTSAWGGVALFIAAPIVLTVFVWPYTAAPGNVYGTGNWFNWVKTYSALAGCVGFMALRFVKWRGADGRTHHLYEKRWALCFPPLILAVNIAEAVVRDVQMFSFGLWDGAVVDHVWMISGPWNIMNAIAGVLNIITICGWFGIFVSKDKSKRHDLARHDLSPAPSPRSSRSAAHGCNIARKRWDCTQCSPWRYRSSTRLRKFPPRTIQPRSSQ